MTDVNYIVDDLAKLRRGLGECHRIPVAGDPSEHPNGPEHAGLGREAFLPQEETDPET